MIGRPRGRPRKDGLVSGSPAALAADLARKKNRYIGRPRRDGLIPGSPAAKATDLAKRRGVDQVDPRLPDMQRLVQQGQTLQQVGNKYGISRERVRQILQGGGVTDTDQRRRRIRSQASIDKAKAKQYDTLLDLMANAYPCKVCGGWVIRPGRPLTCSSECSQLWRIARYRLDPEQHERHRIMTAKSILRHPEGKKPDRIEWAKRMLSDNPPPPNREYHVPESRTTQALVDAGYEKRRADRQN